MKVIQYFRNLVIRKIKFKKKKMEINENFNSKKLRL
jgi:hypothetical protein